MNTEVLDTILVCLEQRTLFMTSIYNLTKQLQVKASQEEILFDNLLDVRQDYMTRIDRCDLLIQVKLQELDAEQQKAVNLALSGRELNQDSSQAIEAMSQYVMQYNALLEQTQKLDAEAIQLVKNRHTDIKNRINEIRHKRVNIKQ
ncbi:hypothetical protein RBG61_06245 [Paludicola sp. MB14-C6]|uniref:hypothetical protein n=1 Tax=Paludihabitans sp. MB14-C6 TaxID=3070656 RepID=UPI0027DD5C08|nr:hypothetical protein [Paludicola sp. MB14-C6]WMJ24264.1 hypothetical protein RBG61_06245 [Paludicola sp. MB14-C6]